MHPDHHRSPLVLDFERRRVQLTDRSGNTARDPQVAARASARTHPHRDRGGPVLVRAAYLPQPEHAEALELGLLDATVHREHWTTGASCRTHWSR